MGWRGPYIPEPGVAYVNESSEEVVTYDCFTDGWCNPLIVNDSESTPEYGRSATFDLNFGNREEDEDYYGALGGVLASPGANGLFDRTAGVFLDPNNIRPGGGTSEMFDSDGREDDDVFVPLYKRDLWANIAPDNVIEAYEGGSPGVNTPVEIVLQYQSGQIPSTIDKIYGVAVIYPDPTQAAGFNVVELMDSSQPLSIVSDPQYIYKNAFEAIEVNQYIPIGYAFFYVMVSHHQNVGNQPVGFCPALTQRLGWKEAAWNGTTITKVYGSRVCVKNGVSTVSVKVTLLGGG
jgi:hypothetical protein